MDIQAAKLELVKEILEVENESLLQKFFDLLRIEKNEESFTLSEIEKREIEIGIQQFKEGKFVSAREFISGLKRGITMSSYQIGLV